MTPATLTLTAAAVLLLASTSSARASIEAGQGGASFDLGNITITQGANIKLAGGVNYAMTVFDTITLVRYEATVWVEVSRSVNA